MSASDTSRRQFLLQTATGLSAAWIAANYAAVVEAGAFAQESAQAGPAAKLAYFTPEQAIEVDAMTSQIIPTDSTPGAHEAHVVNFIDRALTTYDKGRQGDYVKGLAALQAQTVQMFPSVTAFSALNPAQQVQVLTAMEKTPFFNLVRTHTITGFFASPAHGGNFNKVGWKLVSYDDSLNFKPPFGYYDAQVR